MKLFAIDTTGERLSVALAVGEKVRARLARPAHDQDEQLTAETDRLLRSAKLKLKDLDAFVAPTGPGRFTGIRVGLTFAGVVAKALKKPAIGVSWLEACAWKAASSADGLIVAVVPGWKGEFFFQVFKRDSKGPRAAHPPRWSDPAGLSKRIDEDLGGAPKYLVGPGAFEALKALSSQALAEAGDPSLRAADLLMPARVKLERGEVSELEPLYIKPAHYER